VPKVRSPCRSTLDPHRSALALSASQLEGDLLMSELNSRVFLATEAIVIGLPLTVLFLAGVPTQFDHSVGLAKPDALIDRVSGVVALAALLCLWRLIAAFVVRGRAGLRQLSAYWWVLPIAGVALAVQVAGESWTAPVVERSWLNDFVWGLPLLVPLLHLIVERWLSTRAKAAPDTGALPLGLRTRSRPPHG
jgi:hypothetical protein